MNAPMSLIAQEARKACEAFAAGDVARYEVHLANMRRARDAFNEWLQTGDYWAGRFAAPELRGEGLARASYRQCRLCGCHAMRGGESAHVRWCDEEQRRVAQLQARELQDLRTRGLL